MKNTAEVRPGPDAHGKGLRSAVRFHGVLGLVLTPVWRRAVLSAWCLMWGHDPYWHATYDDLGNSKGNWRCQRCACRLGVRI